MNEPLFIIKIAGIFYLFCILFRKSKTKPIKQINKSPVEEAIPVKVVVKDRKSKTKQL